MSEEFHEISEQEPRGEQATASSATPEKPQPRRKINLMQTLAQLGLGETVARLATNILTVISVGLVIWIMQAFFKDVPLGNRPQTALAAGATPTETVSLVTLPQPANSYRGITRQTKIHTIIPNRPRENIVKYTVIAGDTIFGIAEKYGLQPQTVLWGNYYILRDDPHNLKPDQELNILPVDGTYYEWQAGDGLNAVARFFGVNPEDIINYPPNQLNTTALGDFANPNIQPGTWLIVPGGERQFISWSAPIGVTRDNPAVARQMGPGACGTVTDGAVGYGAFIWPANKHYLSGFDYSPETNHRGLDIAGSLGEGLYAVDAGVIVYAGWNDWGYGDMVVIDHGNGWQSLYAHMSAINVICGQSVGQGEVIGAVGSTGRSSGPHLHFELMHSQYGKVNPWLYLPPP